MSQQSRGRYIIQLAPIIVPISQSGNAERHLF